MKTLPEEKVNYRDIQEWLVAAYKLFDRIIQKIEVEKSFYKDHLKAVLGNDISLEQFDDELLRTIEACHDAFEIIKHDLPIIDGYMVEQSNALHYARQNVERLRKNLVKARGNEEYRQYKRYIKYIYGNDVARTIQKGFKEWNKETE
jgi:hypothetical protein